MATDDPVMRSTILGVLVLDRSPDWDRLCERYERATRLAPVLRSKVVEGPLDLQTPRVVVDPNFDLGWHMTRLAMPKGSTWSDVLDFARRQSMTDFDKERPLWRVTVLEDLPGDHQFIGTASGRLTAWRLGGCMQPAFKRLCSLLLGQHEPSGCR